MGLAEWFKDFCSNLTIKDGGTISTRYKSITQRLNKDYWNTTSETAHSLYVGSYGRNSATQGFSDLDVIFQLPYTEYERYNKYSGIPRQKTLKYHHQGVATLTGISGSFKMEWVAALDRNTQTTNPKPEIVTIKARNNLTNGNLVQLCRMIRTWKQKWSVPIVLYCVAVFV